MTADHLQLTCYNGTLTLSWRTNTTYGGEISEIPEDLKSTLNEKIEDKGRAFTLFLFDNCQYVKKDSHLKTGLYFVCAIIGLLIYSKQYSNVFNFVRSFKTIFWFTNLFKTIFECIQFC